MKHSISSDQIIHELEKTPKYVAKAQEFLSELTSNAVDHNFLNNEMKWLQLLIKMRCKELFLEENSEFNEASKIPELPLPDDESPYGIVVNKYELLDTDRVLLALGVAAALYPSLFKSFIQIEESNNAFAIEAGGEYNKANRSFKPTFQTALFLLAGKDLSLWSDYSTQLIKDGIFI